MYEPIEFVNGSAPALNAANLAHMQSQASEAVAQIAVDSRFVRVDRNPFVIVAGDSISSYDASYTTAWSRLGPNFAGDVVEDWRVFATGGADMEELADQYLETILALDPAPGYGVIALGTNDIGDEDPLSVIRDRLDVWLDAFESRGIMPILWAPPPRGASDTALNTATAAWASYIRGIGRARGWEVLDAHRILAISPEGTLDPALEQGDGIHPNYAGHLTLGRAFAEVLHRVMTRPLHRLIENQQDPAKSAGFGLFLEDSNSDGRANGVNASGSPTPSLVAADFGNAQRFSAASGTTPSGTLYWDTTGLTAGHTYDLSYVLEGDLHNLIWAVEITARSASASVAANIAPANRHDQTTGLRLLTPSDRLRFNLPRFVLPAGADRIRAVMGVSGGEAEADSYVQVSQWTVTDLTDLGLA